jgi:hypothetical protein
MFSSILQIVWKFFSERLWWRKPWSRKLKEGGSTTMARSQWNGITSLPGLKDCKVEEVWRQKERVLVKIKMLEDVSYGLRNVAACWREMLLGLYHPVAISTQFGKDPNLANIVQTNSAKPATQDNTAKYKIDFYYKQDNTETKLKTRVSTDDL